MEMSAQKHRSQDTSGAARRQQYEEMQGRESELSSPQHKLIDFIHTIFKKNDQQVPAECILAQGTTGNVKEQATAAAPQDAAPTAEDGSALQQCAPAGTEQQQQCCAAQEQAESRCQRDSASTLDADGAAAAAAAACAGMEVLSTQRSPAAFGSVAFNAVPAPGPGQGPAGCSTAEQRAVLDTAQAHHNHHEQQQQAPSTTTTCPARLSTAMHSEPCPNGSADGIRITAAGSQQRKVLCASVNDLYQELFGDVPLPSTGAGACSSAEHSPYGGHLSSIRGVSSMSPMTTSSAFCHQQAAAAAILGGSHAGMGVFGMPAASSPPAGSPPPMRCNSSSLCGSSFDGNSGSTFGCGAAAQGAAGCADCPAAGADGSSTVQQMQAPTIGDLLPPGAYPPPVRIRLNNNSNTTPAPVECVSGSDGCSSSMFPDDSPSCCSSSAGGGNLWPAADTDDGPSVALSSLGSGQGWGSRGSLRYGSPSAASAQQQQQQQQHRSSSSSQHGSVSAPGSADGKPTPKNSLRTRWSNWISGNSPKGRVRGGSSQDMRLQVQDSSAVSQQQQGPNPSWIAHSRLGSPKRSVLSAQSAPGNAAAQALHNSMAGRAAAGAAATADGGSASDASCRPPAHPLVHCHSNPELVQVASVGSVGHGRPQFQRSTGPGGGAAPPCARSLFGSVPQMERPLMMSGSMGNHSSSGWMSGPGGVSFGAHGRSESFRLLADDVMSVASADEDVIRQVNADNVLSSTWGPGSQGAASGPGGPSGPHPSSSHPKLLAFKYCAATSPLNHPGRSSPFNSTRGSPFNSPRGTRDSIHELLPLRSTASAAAASCPGSPLAARHSHAFSSSVHSTPAAASTHTPLAVASAGGDSTGAAAASAAAGSVSSSHAQQQPQQQGHSVLKKHPSSQQLVLESAASAGSNSDQQQPLDTAPSAGGSDAGASCSSSGGSNTSSSSSSKPPLQGRPVRGLLRTPPPPLPLPLQAPSPACASTEAAAATEQCAGAAAASSSQAGSKATADPQMNRDGASSSGRGGCSAQNRGSTGPTAGKPAAAGSGPPPAEFSSGNRRVSAPAGLSAFVMRFSSSSGAGSSHLANSPKTAASRGQQGTSSGGHALAGPESLALIDAELASTSSAGSGSVGSSSSSSHPHGTAFSRAGGHSLPLPLPSCSIDVGSPKHQQQQLPPAPSADARCSPRRQSSSRLGASGGLTTPSRLSHNSTMAEALVTSSGGAGSGAGGFALQRTSSCCSSSSGAKFSGGRSSNGCGVSALPGHDGGLLSTASVPLPDAYHRGSRGARRVDCSDSSDDSWMGSQPGSGTVAAEGMQEQGLQEEQQQEGQQGQQPGGNTCTPEPRGAGLSTAQPAPAAAAGGRCGSCNGASDVDTAHCAYPSWTSSNCWSPLLPFQQDRSDNQQPVKLPAVQQQQQQADCAQRRQPGQPQGVPDAACTAAAAGRSTDGSSCTGAEDGSADGDAAAAAAIPPSLPEVDFLEKIGRGSFGDVFKGVWCGSVVAVKVIQVKQPSALSLPVARGASSQQQQQHSHQQPELRSHPLGGGCAASDAPTATATAAVTTVCDSQAAQVALELAQHEYESWLNANLRHPNIVQLFTSFTIGLEERSSSSSCNNSLLPSALLMFGGGSSAGDDGTVAAGEECAGGRRLSAFVGDAGAGAGLSWRTHLVMEFCELGTMQDLLQRGVFRQGALPGASHICWVLATAKEFCTAVSYLHSMDVVHGDLKSSNVLLKAAAVTAWDSRGFVAKVSDFGLSRVMDAINAANGDPPLTPSSTDAAFSAAAAADPSSTGGAAPATAGGVDCPAGGAAGGGSLGWEQPCQPRFGALSHAAPELIQGEALSKQSDVYSIGVLLWELLTGQAPFYGMHPGQLLSLKLSQHTSELLPLPASTPPGFAQLCLDCWAEHPPARPGMAAVVQRINELAVSLLGQEQAVAMFPDVAASLAAQRRQAALAAAAGAAAPRC